MTPPKEISDLIERFDRNKDQYTSGNYNEAQLRQEFVNPFFMALGWDIDNKQGFAEPYKEVIHEDAIKIGGATKAPDYCFRIGGTRKFFVEAKNPSINVKENIDPAYQLRRYAWSAKLPLSILTDFEEFAIYDCRLKPLKTDKSSNARIHYLTYNDYIPQWDLITSVFSKEAVLKGSFDKYAETARGKKGTAEVDDAFLKEIESWRELLAKNIALRNGKLSQPELNFAVQRTIDRIIFLRICEDRGIELYGKLQGLVNGARVYPRLCEQFYRADEKYNSGLFHFEQEKGRPEGADELTPKLHIDDKPLIEIISKLYYPDCPYEFSVLPADILGQVYEQFLGKVIRLTTGHQAKVEDKPEVKKAGGVYYTPTYIVDYIVKNTIGKLVEHKTPKQVSLLRVLDPACGSGSFLIGAYQYLLDWHRDWYLKDDPTKYTSGKNAALFTGPGGDWRLTTSERKRVLLNNIYGVDIDSQAVEVTKLSLLLKVLEGENEQTINQQLKMFHERALPDLGNNVKCGNSLIGPDFYAGKQLSLLGDEEKYRVNVFDWKSGFKEIMDAGGFDAVIGNPPYVQIENILQNHRDYFIRRYGENDTLGKRYDIYQIFLLRAIELLRNLGHLGFILPNTFLIGNSYAFLRKRIFDNCRISEIVDLPQGVFVGVTVDNVLLFLCREIALERRLKNQIKVNKLNAKSQKSRVASTDWDDSYAMSQSAVIEGANYEMNIQGNPRLEMLFQNLQKVSIPLGEVTDSTQGIILYETSQQATKSEYTGFKKKPNWMKLLRGKEIGRYELRWKGEYVHYGRWLGRAREERFFSQPKILLHAMRNKSLARRLVGTFDAEHYYNAHNLANIILKEGSPYDLRYVLGLFNSQLINFWYKGHFPNVNINPGEFRTIPIHAINFSDQADKSRHDRMVELVEQMLSLHKQLPAAKTEQEKTVIQRQIDATDKQIDQLVYELYGLTEEEIKIVEQKPTE